MCALQRYLSSVKAAKDGTRRIILGNEAADLDSMASSIAYGYLLSLQDTASVALPVMPIPRADFKLRTEAVYLFREAGIELDDLVFFDDVDFDKLIADGAVIILVDHNRLSLALEQYHLSVVGVVDHHKDEEMYSDANPRIIQTIGSTTSLVGMEFQRAGSAITEDIAILLCGTILLDTVNLSEKAGRVTDADVAIVSALLPLCPLPRNDFFDNIQRAKFNTEGLSTADLLRKDYKEFQFETAKCGIGSALLPISQWVERDRDLFSGFVDFATTRRLDVLLSMNAFANPNFGRDLVIYCAAQKVHDALYEHLQKNSFDLSLCECGEKQVTKNGFMNCFHQGNIDISRKKLQPLLAEFYKHSLV